MSGFDDALARHFPGALPQRELVRRSHEQLASLGFTAANTIACVGTCRDEVCRPFADDAQQLWGEAFNFSSLAGLLTLGKTGFGAAHHHAPIVEGRERFVYLCLPHIGLGPNGEIGMCERVGRPGRSGACGALQAMLSELQQGELSTDVDPDDVELSLLRRRLRPLLPHGDAVDLLTLTRLTHQAILEDLEHMIGLTVDSGAADYGVVTGIQIHGPAQRHYAWPGALYAVVGGQRHLLTWSA